MSTIVTRLLQLMGRKTAVVPTVLTSEQVLEIAKREIENTGLWRPEVRVGARVDTENAGRVVWDVVTNVPNRGAHARLIVDDATGAVVKRWLVSR
jgi:hypothetical protein